MSGFESDDGSNGEDWEPEAVVVPIEDAIDLHTFHPREATLVLKAYFEACREKGLFEVRVIHGKGTGVLKARVESYLKKEKQVLDFYPAGPERGGWGATMVRLRPLGESR